MEYYLVLDVGGTQIKAGVLTSAAQLLNDKIHVFDAHAQADKETVLQTLFSAVEILVGNIRDTAKHIAGIGLAFPGNFDYPNGVSLIRGNAKYDSIYQVNIREDLTQRIANSEISRFFAVQYPILFLNDIEAFALGECHYGAAKAYNKVFALCIGTGTGSAFLRDGKPINTPEPGLPPHGWIYNTPFRDSIVDDYISRRGVMALSEKYTGNPLDGKPLAELANSGDSQALRAFAEFGQNLCHAVKPFIMDFRPDCLILGGQIAKSVALFGNSVSELCSHQGIVFTVSQDTSRAAFRGLFYGLKQKLTSN